MSNTSSPAGASKNTIKPGDVLTARSIGDSNCIFRAEIASRTDKSAMVRVDGEGKWVRRKINVDSDGNEFIWAMGIYAGAPMFRAIADRENWPVTKVKPAPAVPTYQHTAAVPARPYTVNLSFAELLMLIGLVMGRAEGRRVTQRFPQHPEVMAAAVKEAEEAQALADHLEQAMRAVTNKPVRPPPTPIDWGAPAKPWAGVAMTGGA